MAFVAVELFLVVIISSCHCQTFNFSAVSFVFVLTMQRSENTETERSELLAGIGRHPYLNRKTPGVVNSKKIYSHHCRCYSFHWRGTGFHRYNNCIRIFTRINILLIEKWLRCIFLLTITCALKCMLCQCIYYWYETTKYCGYHFLIAIELEEWKIDHYHQLKGNK